MKATNCKTEHMREPAGIDTLEQFLSWNCEGGQYQSAYQVQIYADGRMIYDTGKVESADMHCLVKPTLHSRERLSWQVRLWDEVHKEGVWSDLNYYEMGLLEVSDWKAIWIAPAIGIAPAFSCEDGINRLAKNAWDQKKHKKGEEYAPHQPATYLKKTFSVSAVAQARLYISAFGMYEAWLNGTRVGNMVLAPGCSNYNYEVCYQTYDVQKLLTEGENTIEIILGDGWYRSTSGVDGDRALFGNKLSVLAQLEIDKKVVAMTDCSWKAHQEGPLLQNDMQQGEVYDARKEEQFQADSRTWHQLNEESVDYELLCASNTVPIIENEELPGKIMITPNGETVIDFGQNLAGYVEFSLTAKAGDTLQLTHGETLDEKGNFTVENFQDRKRHKEGGTYQMIFYTCKEGVNHYKPRFTIMGFRYVKVETKADLSQAKFVAHAVYSSMETTAEFTCGNELVNQLVKNSIWSQKGNFCDVPTDCPTRERAGWTGDAGLFVKTGLTLMDSYPVYQKWLAQCRYGQYKDGRVANIAPPNNNPGFLTKMLSGSVGWGDACILVPYELYQRYGDIRILQENYAMMKDWYTFLEKRAKKSSIRNLFTKGKYRRYTMETGLNYGEWCEPGSTPIEGMRNGNYDVATAFFSYSGKLLSEIAAILGEEEDARYYQNISELARKAFVEKFTDYGVIHSTRQCQYVRPIEFQLLSEAEAGKAAEQLNQLVKDNGYHLNTGFLTTPSICGVLARYGYVDTAYRLLLQEEMPSWLYEVKQGATTLWETWDGINEQGVPKESLNHYSYGAIAGWLISGVGGIQYNHKNVVIAPTVHPTLGYATAKYQSPAGLLISAWKYEGDNIRFEIEIPCNVQATIQLPDGTSEEVGPGTYVRNVDVQRIS